MKVLVLGAGVIGVTSAYYLAKAGHEVVVIDRQPGAGLETSFANAGEVSPGYASPWAGPGVPLKAIKWLLMRHGPLVLRPHLDPRMWLWILQMLRNCTAARYAVNKARMVRIAEYSRDCLAELRAQTGISYDERALGTLQLFRTQKQVDAAARDIAILRQYRVPYQLLHPRGCVAAEPGLASVQHLIAGGLRLPGDETGDCHLFTQRLAALAAQAGVTFRYGVQIERIEANAQRVDGIRVGNGVDRDDVNRDDVMRDGVMRADAYVLALGSFSPLLARPLGLSLPVYPVKGYSITVPIVDADRAPVSTVMDETFKVAITRLGARIRVGGTAELSGYDATLRPRRRDTLVRSLTDLFPSAGDLAAATFWCGLRPMTPDGPPLIGRTRLANLYVNTGHGTLGWTMACGSGQLMADLISGKSPKVDVDALAISG